MKHILVVEDDAVNALVFQKTLERRGSGMFQVTVTERADEVIDQCRAGQVDLVIMDVSLTNTWWGGRPVSGVDLCRLIKSDDRSSRTPVILATAHAMRGDAESLLAESGADDYVAKPVLDHAHFLEQVRQLIERAA